jgi:hypothetical protein
MYATARRLPHHEVVEDFTWIGNPNRSDVPPLCDVPCLETRGLQQDFLHCSVRFIVVPGYQLYYRLPNNKTKHGLQCL